MKKLLSVLLALFVTLNLSACVSVENKDDDASKNDSSNQTSETIKPEDATIQETVLYDESGVKITAKELDIDGTFGPSLKLLIENNTDQNLTVQSHSSSVNGYMIENIMSTDVAAGKKANDTLTFMESDLESCGIALIADMEFSFHIFDSDSWDTYTDTKMIQLKTSLADSYEYRFDDSGKVLYDDNGIKIVAKGISEDNSYLGTDLMLYVYNGTDDNITVQARNVSVNGFMLDPIFSEDVTAKKHAVSGLTFMSSDLEENDIKEITDIEISFHIFDTDSWDTIIDTDTINLTY